MRLLLRPLAMALGLAALSGCTDAALLAPAAGPSAATYVPAEQCESDPNCGSGVNGVIHDGTGNGVLPSVAGDPSPGAAGVWLGDYSSARWCYANYNSWVTDADKDWLDDKCEYELAKAFAPAVAISAQEDCELGEPYWAVKYFPNIPAYGTGEFVRIAYMPAYYRDCGDLWGHFASGHRGDSEFIMVGIHHNPTTRHWEVKEMYTSAHAGTITNSSEYTGDPSKLQYPSGRALTYPRVWVAKNKHANYRSQSECNSGAKWFDDCDDNTTRGRLRVLKHRNVGSRYVDNFPNCVASQNPLYYQNGRTECFYTSRNFEGWQVSSEDGVTPYRNFLMNYVFECYDYTYMFSGSCPYWGPGSTPPSSTRTTGVVNGPTQVSAQQSYSWSGFVTGGSTPYQFEWYRQYGTATPVLVATSSSSTAGSTAGMTMYVSTCHNFTLILKIRSADGQTWEDRHDVAVTTCPPPPLGVSISGPYGISQKGTYTYTSSVSGATSVTYDWQERTCEDSASQNCTAWSGYNITTSTYTRVLGPDCSGTGQRNIQLKLVVRASDGRTATDTHQTSLCGTAIEA